MILLVIPLLTLLLHLRAVPPFQVVGTIAEVVER